MNPLLKWVGGKRWLLRNYPSIIPKKFDRYIEPFAGGAAVFFSLRPKVAILSDLNADLIQFYKCLRSDPFRIQTAMFEHQRLHCKEHYYQVRSWVPIDAAERAARFLYLNRACFNGIYRVNRNGYFNVPKGTKHKVLFDDDDFSLASKVLNRAELLNDDFEQVINSSCSGDFVFVDPPYTVRHNTNGFVKYNEKMFSWADQERLAETIRFAAKRGARLLITNADHESIHELYSGIGRQVSLDRYSVIGGGSEYRSTTSECLILVGLESEFEAFQAQSAFSARSHQPRLAT